MPERMEAIRANPQLRFKFPDPEFESLRLASKTSPIMSIEQCRVMIGTSDGISRGVAAAAVAGVGLGVDPTEAVMVPLLESVSMQLTMGSKVALVGPNGHGKTSLMRAICEILVGRTLMPVEKGADIKPAKKTGGISMSKASPASIPSRQLSQSPARVPPAPVSRPATTGMQPESIVSNGKALEAISLYHDSTSTSIVVQGISHTHPNLRVGVVSQNHIDSLADHLTISPVAYMIHTAKSKLLSPAPSVFALGGSSAGDMSEADARAHLGLFALGGQVALQLIGSLSGGQKARLVFAAACINRPHLLLLDEVSCCFANPELFRI
jgi:ABC-type Mn2+/Zn2+ transport system ATPase subunit